MELKFVCLFSLVLRTEGLVVEYLSFLFAILLFRIALATTYLYFL